MPPRPAATNSTAERTIAAMQTRQHQGCLRVLTAAAFQQLVARVGLEQAYQQTDVVTAADTLLTDQGALLLTLGPTEPPIRLRELQLGGVAAQVGGSGADLLLPLGGGLGDPARRSGAQLISELLAGEALPLQGLGEPTPLQPRLELSGVARLSDFGVARLLLHRAICENGIVAVNSAEGLLRTAHGPLLGPLVSGLYTGGGAGSIGMTMPGLSQLGPGSPVLVGGGLGWVLGAGSGHQPTARRQESGHALVPAATAAVVVDLNALDPAAVRSCFLEGHGAAVLVTIAAPVPLLTMEIAAQAAIDAEDLQAPVLDLAIPRRVKPQLAMARYSDLERGVINVQGQAIRCAPAHSPRLAAAAADRLRQALEAGRFPLQAVAAALPAAAAWRPFDP